MSDHGEHHGDQGKSVPDQESVAEDIAEQPDQRRQDQGTETDNCEDHEQRPPDPILNADGFYVVGDALYLINGEQLTKTRTADGEEIWSVDTKAEPGSTGERRLRVFLRRR